MYRSIFLILGIVVGEHSGSVRLSDIESFSFYVFQNPSDGTETHSNGLRIAKIDIAAQESWRRSTINMMLT
jgi:hypothetical protein